MLNTPDVFAWREGRKLLAYYTAVMVPPKDTRGQRGSEGASNGGREGGGKGASSHILPISLTAQVRRSIGCFAERSEEGWRDEIIDDDEAGEVVLSSSRVRGNEAEEQGRTGELDSFGLARAQAGHASTYLRDNAVEVRVGQRHWG